MPTEPLSRRTGLIQIGEMLHASIPAPGAAMRALREKAPAGTLSAGPELDSLKENIASQAAAGADFIDINVDALGGETAADMRAYAALVRECGDGVPASIDSSNPDVLLAGLETWFSFDGAPAPLLNSIPFNEMDRYEAIFDLRAQHPFSVVLLLIGLEGPPATTEGIIETARAMFDRARAAGFAPEDIYFDTVTLGIASDGCMTAMGEMKPSHTYNAFRAIRQIRNDAALGGAHTIQGVSNWAYGARKRRIGHIRAYVSVAMEYGLDAAIVDVSKDFAIKEADPELVGFVKGFASLDGSDDSMMAYQNMMQEARAGEWI